MAIVVYYIPEPEWFQNHSSFANMAELPTENRERRNSHKKILFTGIVTALGIFKSHFYILIISSGISLHNFPEGVAVYLGSLKGFRFGVPLAVAIMLHNLPEGMAVAMPIYFATRRYRFFRSISN